MTRRMRVLAACAALSAACGVAAQDIYRWTDEKGRKHVTDTPPPPSAKGVHKDSAAALANTNTQSAYDLALAVKESPVVLYSAPACEAPCSAARALLNQRGVPFREVMVWTVASGEDLIRVSGERVIPTLLVGKRVQKGFQPDAYNALLDSARYPKAGALPPRSQAVAPLPKEYLEAKEEVDKAEAARSKGKR